jgi:hypothetical protein
VVLLTCRPTVAPQGDLGAPASPSWTRSDEPKVVGEVLTDNEHTANPLRGVVESRATSPPVADARVETPPPVADAGGITSTGDIRATTSPMIIDIDPINARPVRAEDLVRHQPQIDQALVGPETSGAQVPQPLPSSSRLPRRTINWNHTPWQEDWFEETRTCRPCRRASLPSIPR